MIKKIAPANVSMADIMGFATIGAVVESSRIHVGPTTAALPHFYVVRGTSITTQIVDMTFYDNTCTPHLSVSTRGTFEIGDASHITYMMRAHSQDEQGGLVIGDRIADWHTGRINTVFPGLNLQNSSSVIRDNPELVKQVIMEAWEFIYSHQTHAFKHYVEADGSISKKPAPEHYSVVLDDLAMIDGQTGWKIPNIVTITLDILLGSKNGFDYYHLCGGAMWKYIDEYDYKIFIEAILHKMKRYGREMHLINTTSFRVFSMKEDAGFLNEIWLLWKRWKHEETHRKKAGFERCLYEKVRERKMPWYDGCEGKHEITQHDLGTAEDIYVPSWAIHANFAELAEFVAYTVKIWKSRKK